MVKGLLAAVFSLLLSLPCFAAELKVAVAANFKPLLSSLKSDFEQTHNTKVLLSSASTGVLYAQIRRGAPFDLFLAADEKRPQLLEQQQLTVTNSRQTYAQGLLVLWHTKGKPDVSLLTGWSNKIAMANPKTAPYGLAGKSVLEHLQLWQDKRPQIVTGSNIAQTQQFVQSGNVELGFIALSQAKLLGSDNQYWLIPEHWYAPLKQQVVILKRSQMPSQAKAFLTWLMSKPVQQRIFDAGYARHDAAS